MAMKQRLAVIAWHKLRAEAVPLKASTESEALQVCPEGCMRAPLAGGTRMVVEHLLSRGCRTHRTTLA